MNYYMGLHIGAPGLVKNMDKAFTLENATLTKSSAERQ
jgi:hypothetical protein